MNVVKSQSAIKRIIELSQKFGFVLYEGKEYTKELYEAFNKSVINKNFSDEVFVNKYFRCLKGKDYSAYIKTLKVLETDHRSFQQVKGLLDVVQDIETLNEEEGIGKTNVSFLFTKKSVFKELHDFLNTDHGGKRCRFVERYINEQFFYVVVDDLARSGSRSMFKRTATFLGKDLVSYSYYRHKDFGTALDMCFSGSSILIDGYPLSLYFDRYKILYENQMAFTEYKWSKSMDGRYWKGWIKKNGFSKLGLVLHKCEELILVDGLNIPQKESRKLTLSSTIDTYYFYFDRNINGGKFSEPKLLIDQVGSVNIYVQGINKIKNYLNETT